MHEFKKKTAITSCLIIGIVVLFIILSLFFNYYSNGTKKVILNVVTETRGSWISGGIKHYYVVYDNGKTEETNEFEISKNEIYDLYEIEKIQKNNLATSDDIPIHSKEIIDIIETMENSLVDKYFIIDNRYFLAQA